MRYSLILLAILGTLTLTGCGLGGGGGGGSSQSATPPFTSQHILMASTQQDMAPWGMPGFSLCTNQYQDNKLEVWIRSGAQASASYNFTIMAYQTTDITNIYGTLPLVNPNYQAPNTDGPKIVFNVPWYVDYWSLALMKNTPPVIVPSAAG